MSKFECMVYVGRTAFSGLPSFDRYHALRACQIAPQGDLARPVKPAQRDTRNRVRVTMLFRL